MDNPAASAHGAHGVTTSFGNDGKRGKNVSRGAEAHPRTNEGWGATLEPAEYFSMANRMGSVDIGKVADLVLLDASPLDDIRNTKEIAAVISKGDVLDIDALIQSARAASPFAAR